MWTVSYITLFFWGVPILSTTPGGRGLLREVWISESGSFNELNLDDTDQRPRSELTSVQERLYRDNSHTREFGERFYFTQRYSGFFIPPLTCLYTFSILSDDLCRLYLSPNNSADHKELIAYSPQWTRGIWDYWPSQVSEPVYLEEGKPYYIEATNNQGGGPWELGVGAKIHCLDHTAYPYDGDREIQRINISSIDVKEQHVSDCVCLYRVDRFFSSLIYPTGPIYLHMHDSNGCNIKTGTM